MSENLGPYVGLIITNCIVMAVAGVQHLKSTGRRIFRRRIQRSGLFLHPLIISCFREILVWEIARIPVPYFSAAILGQVDNYGYAPVRVFYAGCCRLIFRRLSRKRRSQQNEHLSEIWQRCRLYRAISRQNILLSYFLACVPSSAYRRQSRRRSVSRCRHFSCMVHDVYSQLAGV